MKAGRIKDAETVVRAVIEDKDRAAIVRCSSTLLSGFLHQGNLEKAGMWLKELDALGVTMPVGVLSIFLDSHAKLRNTSRVREFAVRLTDHPEFKALSTRSYNSLISAFTRIDDLDAARRYFERMIAEGLNPNQITFCTLIGACGRLGKVEDAIAIYERMKTDFKQQPDLQTYISLIKLCRHRPDLRLRAFQFFDELRARGLVPNHSTYHALLTVCAKQHDVQRALELWDAMHQQGLVPDLMLYNTLLGVFGRDQLDAADAVFKELQAAGFSPSTVTYNMMIKCAALNRNFAKALAYFDLLRASPQRPDEYTFNSLLSAVRQPEDLTRAEVLYNEMRLQGMRPNIVVLNSLARAAALGKNLPKANHFLNQITVLGLQPDSATSAVMAQIGQVSRSQGAERSSTPSQ